MLNVKKFQNEEFGFVRRTGENSWVVEGFGLDCKWLHTSELRLAWCLSRVLLDSGKFGRRRKSNKNSLTGILRCLLISGVGGL